MANTYLNKTLSGSPTNNLKWTWSAWVKKTKNGTIQPLFYADGGSNANFTKIEFHTNDKILAQNYVGSSTYGYKVTTSQYRDTNAWYHIVMRYDSANGDNTQRFIIWVNGVDSGTLPMDSNTFPDASRASIINAGNEHRIGRGNNNVGSDYFDGVMSHVHFCDGYAYSASDFGETDSATGQWKIKTNPSVSYGTNGFFILKDGNSVTDQSGNSNNWAVGGGTLTNTEDNPSNVFATFNPLWRARVNTVDVGSYLSNGNLQFNSTGSDARLIYFASTIGVTSGKYYWEVKSYDGTGGAVGVCYNSMQSNSNNQFWDNSNLLGLAIKINGNNLNGKSGDGGGALGVTYSAGDIYGFALDMDNYAVYVHINGTYVNSGSPTSGASKTGSLLGLLTSGTSYLNSGEPVFPFFADLSTSSHAGLQANFGNGYFGTTAISSEGTNASGIGKFEYDVPTGYTALSTKGLNE